MRRLQRHLPTPKARGLEVRKRDQLLDLPFLRHFASFFSAGCHDLSQAVTALQGVLELASYRAQSPEELEKVLEESSREAERMVSILRAMQHAAALQESINRSTTVLLSEMAKRVCDDLLPMAESRGLKVILDSEKDLSVAAGSHHLLWTVFNLLDQALESANPASPIQVVLRREGRRACLAIAFSGAPPAPEGIAYQGDGYLNLPDNPFAAGGRHPDLALARLTAEALGGRLEVERGSSTTTFCLYLPLVQ